MTKVYQDTYPVCYTSLTVEYILFGDLLKAPKHDHGSEKKKNEVFLNFFEVTYQKPLKTNPFSECIMQKTENWHFGDHQIWGGSVS